MSATNGIRAGAAYVELSLTSSKLTKGLKAAQKQLGDWGKAIRQTGLEVFASGAAIVTTLLGTVKAAASMGAELLAVSERTGMTTKSVQQLEYAANQAGVGFEALQTGLGKMEKTIGDAEMAGDKSVETFTRLGVSINDLKTMSPDKQFETIAQAISKVEDPAKRSLFAMQIFGRGGLQLMPLMLKGAAGIAKLREEASSLGLVLSDDDIKASKAFEGKLNTLWKVIGIGAFKIGSTLMPVLTELINKVVANGKAAGEWIMSNSGLIVSALKIGAAIAAAGAALVVLGTLFSAAASIIGGVLGVMSAVGTTIGVVGTVIGTILSPIGLVVAAVVGLGAVIAIQTGAASKALDFLSGVFGTLKSDAMTAFEGIKAALGNGDIALAAKILWATIKLEFNRGVAWLKGIWIDFTSVFKSAWAEATFWIAKILIKSWAGLQTAWNETMGFLSNAFDLFCGSAVTGWAVTMGLLRKAWVRTKGLFDSGINVTAEVQKIDAETAKAFQDEVDKYRNKRDATNAATDKRNGQIDGDEKGALTALEQDRMARQQQILAGELSAEQALQEEIKALKIKLDGLAAEAKNAGKTGPLGNYTSEGGNGNGTPTLPDAGELSKSSVGTFSTIGAGRIGGESSVERSLKDIAHEAAQTAKWTRIVADNAAKKPKNLQR